MHFAHRVSSVANAAPSAQAIYILVLAGNLVCDTLKGDSR
jgi:hypothetical protein